MSWRTKINIKEKTQKRKERRGKAYMGKTVEVQFQETNRVMLAEYSHYDELRFVVLPNAMLIPTKDHNT